MSPRKANEWAESNVSKWHIWRAGYATVLQETWAPLFGSIDALGSVCLRNFSHVLNHCGTVEFRRPPGVDNSADAKHWIAFSPGFVSHSISLEGWEAMRKTKAYPSTDDLRENIMRGVQALRGESWASLKPILDDGREARVTTLDELDRISRRKRVKKQSAFAEKVCSSLTETTLPWLMD
ncbi:hypothetical protein BBP40_007404 [Aspergillus hancockii]|nr:hypothetical protein BBP40_007404 [Aspergillus hancockii]